MADVISDMKKNLNAWWKSNGPKVEDALRHAGKKGEELAQRGKLKIDIFQAQRNLDHKFSELGVHIYKKSAEKGYDVTADEAVAAFRDDISKLEAEIGTLREEYLKVGKEEDLDFSSENDAEDSADSDEENKS